MKKPFKIAGGLAALLVVGSWWMVTNSTNALSQRLATAIQDSGDSREIEMLLSRGANPNYLFQVQGPNSKDKAIALIGDGVAPASEVRPLLVLALDNEEVVKLLLKHGADPNLAYECFGTTWTPLMAAMEDSTPKVIRLLLESGADPNFKTGPSLIAAGTTLTPLKRAAGRPELVSLLKQAGARE